MLRELNGAPVGVWVPFVAWFLRCPAKHEARVTTLPADILCAIKGQPRSPHGTAADKAQLL